MPFKPDFHAPVTVDYGGCCIREVEELIKPFLTLVHPAFFESDSLASPRLPQLFAGFSIS